MLRRTADALYAIHFPVYQSLVAILGAVLCIHILLDYSWGQSFTCGAVTVGAYWLGQGIVTLMYRSARRSSLD